MVKVSKVQVIVITRHPLLMFGMHEEHQQFMACDTQEELTNFFHKMLEIVDQKEKDGKNHDLLRTFTYAMIDHYTGQNINTNQLLNH
jgi:hypothetical protein